MKERPILMSAPMVRAILNGSKTQTRRVVRKQFAHDAIVAEVAATSPEGWQVSGHSGMWWDDAGACLDDAVRCPYGMPGDRLWVREAWAPHPQDTGTVFYRATVEAEPGLPVWSGPWRPSIHMPRRASRITLEITGVRVERLQEISRADAQAEGCHHNDPCDHKRRSCEEIGCEGPDYRVGFRNLWESINGPESWAANPWVWVIEFKKV